MCVSIAFPKSIVTGFDCGFVFPELVGMVRKLVAVSLDIVGKKRDEDRATCLLN